MHRKGTGGVAVALGLLLAPSVVHADPTVEWNRTLDEQSAANEGVASLALTFSGDLISAGRLGERFAVVRQRGSDGEPLWGTLLPTSDPGSPGSATDVAIGKTGDVFASGWARQGASAKSALTVVRLSQLDGSVMWTGAVGGLSTEDDAALALALDKNDDALAAGNLTRTAKRDFAVVKFNGQTGAVLWQRLINGLEGKATDDVAKALAVDGDGNALVTGYLSTAEVGVHAELTVVKLNGNTGQVIWSRRYGSNPSYGFGYAVAVAPGGDAIAAGGLGGRFTVMRLRASDGQLLWKYQHALASISPPPMASVVRLTADGVVASGYIGNKGGQGFVAKLNATNGAPIWEKSVGASATSWGPMFAAVIPSQEVLAAGSALDESFVARLKGSDGQQIWKFAQAGRRPAAVIYRSNALFVGGSAAAGAGKRDHWTMKLSLLPSCVVGEKIRIECACNCGIHQVCVHGKCKTIEPAQPIGHLQKKVKKH